jgi:hypothetical protein
MCLPRSESGPILELRQTLRREGSMYSTIDCGPGMLPCAHRRSLCRLSGLTLLVVGMALGSIHLSVAAEEGPHLTGPPDPPPRGLISARDGQLVDASGERIRFWGMGIVPDPPWIYAMMEQTAHRIRQMPRTNTESLRLAFFAKRSAETARHSISSTTSFTAWSERGSIYI